MQTSLDSDVEGCPYSTHLFHCRVLGFQRKWTSTSVFFLPHQYPVTQLLTSCALSGHHWGCRTTLLPSISQSLALVDILMLEEYQYIKCVMSQTTSDFITPRSAFAHIYNTCCVACFWGTRIDASQALNKNDSLVSIFTKDPHVFP